MNNLLKTAQNWANQDPDQEIRDEVQVLIDVGNTTEVDEVIE